MKRMFPHLQNYVRMVRKVLVSAASIRQQPHNRFTSDGYEVIPDFLSSAESREIIAFAQSYVRGHSYVIPPQHYCEDEQDGGKCYMHHRAESTDINLGMVQFINVQKLDERYSRLLYSVKTMLEKRTGETLVAQSAVVQLDMPDQQTKRRLHTDGLTVRYKAFLYLSDVQNIDDGPYTVIAHSHRHVARKLLNLFYVRWRSLGWSREKVSRSDQFGDMALFYNEKQTIPILGQAGTLILSNQLIVHQGGYNTNPRWALILHYIPSKFWDGKPFDMYQKDVGSQGYPDQQMLAEA